MLGNINLNMVYCRFTATIKSSSVKQLMKIDLVSKPYEYHDACETCHGGSCGGGKGLHSNGVNIMGFVLLKNDGGAVCC